MRVIEVFADVACPFTHVGLLRLVDERARRGRLDVVLRCRAWPLEIVNGSPLEATTIAQEIAALRAEVAPDLFTGFDASAFPATSVPALALAARAYRAGPATGEAVSLALRRALFEEGRDIADPGVLADVAVAGGLPAPATGPVALVATESAVRADYDEGRSRGVIGSPHFFVDGVGTFCPTLDISHDDDGFHVAVDAEGFERFVTRCFP